MKSRISRSDLQLLNLNLMLECADSLKLMKFVSRRLNLTKKLYQPHVFPKTVKKSLIIF